MVFDTARRRAAPDAASERGRAAEIWNRKTSVKAKQVESRDKAGAEDSEEAEEAEEDDEDKKGAGKVGFRDRKVSTRGWGQVR